MDTSPPSRINVERRLGRKVDRIIATCNDEVDELDDMGISRERVDVVPCGVDIERFRPDGPIEPRDGLARIVTVGRVVPRKGFADIIEATALVEDTELVVVGGSPDESGAELARLRGVAAEHGVRDRVRFAGMVPRTRMPGLLRSADAVVCAPWYEPFGIVPLEAMACGRPVIASEVGGMLDTVIGGVNGLHVRPRDPDSIAAGIAMLLRDPALAQRFGEAGRERVCRDFTWRSVARRTEAVYQSLLTRTLVSG